MERTIRPDFNPRELLGLSVIDYSGLDEYAKWKNARFRRLMPLPPAESSIIDYFCLLEGEGILFFEVGITNSCMQTLAYPGSVTPTKTRLYHK